MIHMAWSETRHKVDLSRKGRRESKSPCQCSWLCAKGWLRQAFVGIASCQVQSKLSPDKENDVCSKQASMVEDQPYRPDPFVCGMGSMIHENRSWGPWCIMLGDKTDANDLQWKGLTRSALCVWRNATSIGAEDANWGVRGRYL